MNINVKSLQSCALPYNSVEAATKMMAKLFSNAPFLAFLPNISSKDNLKTITLSNIPGIKVKDNKIIFKNSSEKFKHDVTKLDSAFLTLTTEKIEHYKFDSVFLEKYLQIITRVKPQIAIFNLLGPFTISQMLINKSSGQLLSDKTLRKILIQTICLKAIWIRNKIKECSPDTTPLLILEEPLLYKFGSIKRDFEDITQELIVNMFSKIIQKLKEYSIVICIQSFEKCDWQIPIEAGVDIISLGAYTNPYNINIIPDKINNFLECGGKINWGIVPTKTETLVKSLSIEKIQDLFKKTLYGLIDAGVNPQLVLNNSTISIEGSVETLPIIFAEKALILTNQLAHKNFTQIV